MRPGACVLWPAPFKNTFHLHCPLALLSQSINANANVYPYTCLTLSATCPPLHSVYKAYRGKLPRQYCSSTRVFPTRSVHASAASNPPPYHSPQRALSLAGCSQYRCQMQSQGAVPPPPRPPRPPRPPHPPRPPRPLAPEPSAETAGDGCAAAADANASAKLRMILRRL
jgi:hypothetical protein